MEMFRRIGLYILTGVIIILLINRFWGGLLSSSALTYLLLSIAILICLILVGIYFIFRSAEKPELPQQDVPQQNFEMGESKVLRSSENLKITFSKKEISDSFSRAVRYLKESLSGKSIYEIPWVMMIGEAGCGKTTILKNSGIETDVSQSKSIEEDKTAKKDACNWFFFEKKGVVLDIAGDIVLHKDLKTPERKSWLKLETDTSDEKAWQHLLRLLQDYRPERPIDSLILTIPCNDLISDEQNQPDMIRLSEKADILYKKLRNLQKSLGVSFPVYILITGCDRMDGFQSFCRQKLGRKLRHEIFGWSSPYSVGTAYSSDWIREAFKETYKTLLQDQFRLFAKNIETDDRDNLFLFPSDFQSLIEPLQAYSDRLFKQSAYHESFIFRGLYFCAGNPDPSEINTKTAAEGFFIKDVLEKKIFPEFGLSRPLTGIFLSRNRKVRIAQAAALFFLVIGVIGFWSNYQHLKNDVGDMLPIFRSIEKDLEKQREDNIVQKDAPEVFEKRALNLFKGMSSIKKLRYLFIPPSQFSHIHEAIRKSITIAYNEIILKAMHSKLRQKAGEVVEPRKSDITLTKFLDNVEALEKHVGLYNRLRESDDLKDFGSIVNYLFDVSLKESLFLNNQQFHDALKKTEDFAFDPKIYQIKADFTLRNLIPSFYEEMFERNKIKLSIEKLELQTGKLARTSDYDLKFLKYISDDISEAEKVLLSSANSWISRDQFSIEEFNKVRQSGFFGKETYQEFEKVGISEFKKFKSELGQKRNMLTQSFILDMNDKTLKLSQDTLKLKEDIKKLLSYDFMKVGKISGKLDPKIRLMWDTKLLEKNIESFESYKKFITDELDTFSIGLRTVVKNASRNSMEQKFLEMINQTPVFEKDIHLSAARLEESDTLLEIRNFKASSKLLNKLMGYFYELNMTSSYYFLSAVISYQAARLLNEGHTLLQTENLYGVKGDNLSWWDGREQRPLSLTAFSMADDKELQHHLEMQRNRVRYLAYEYIEPVVTFFLSNQKIDLKENKQLLSTWGRILSELEKYDSKKPENSVNALEKFILFDMNTVNVRNYLEKIKAQELNDQSGDFFIQKRNELRRMLYSRCEILAVGEIVESYRGLKNFFDQKLAGRFPFAKEQETIMAEAEPEDIKDFYRISDKMPPFREILKNHEKFGLSGTHTYNFLAEMEAVRQFFSSYFIPEEKEKKKEEDKKDEKAEAKPPDKKKLPEVPVLDIDVEFRVNRTYEAYANQIMDWNLGIGEQIFKSGSDKHTGRWQWGEPVRFSMRWAKNSATFPVSAGNTAVVNTEEKTVSYESKLRWSLIHFIQQYKAEAADLDRLRDIKPHTMKFKVETMTAQEGKSQKKFDTLAFMRLTLIAPDKANMILSLPAFPAVAPELVWIGEKEIKIDDKRRATYP